MSIYAKNDGRYPDESTVLVRYPQPGTDERDRASWAWLPGSVLGQCGPDEWHIVLDGRGDLAEPDEQTGEPTYPAVYRDSSEIRTVSTAEWEQLRVRRGDDDDLPDSALLPAADYIRDVAAELDQRGRSN